MPIGGSVIARRAQLTPPAAYGSPNRRERVCQCHHAGTNLEFFLALGRVDGGSEMDTSGIHRAFGDRAQGSAARSATKG